MAERIRVFTFVMGKGESSPSLSADAACANTENLTFAISDGVTDSLLPALWSQLLVEHFCKSNKESLNLLFKHENWEAWIKPIQSRWLKATETHVASIPATEIAWQMHRQGEPARATFAGIQLSKNLNSWRAVIIGDSVIFHVRDDKLVDSYLLKQSNNFSSYPQNLASRPNSPITAKPEFLKHEACQGDSFFLATDALAKWMLLRHEHGRSPWNEIKGLRDWKTFYNFIQLKREETSDWIEDDDTALITLHLEDKTHKEQEEPEEDAINGFFNREELPLTTNHSTQPEPPNGVTFPATEEDTDGFVEEENENDSKSVILDNRAVERLLERYDKALHRQRLLTQFAVVVALVALLISILSLGSILRQPEPAITFDSTSVFALPQSTEPTTLIDQTPSMGGLPTPGLTEENQPLENESSPFLSETNQEPSAGDSSSSSQLGQEAIVSSIVAIFIGIVLIIIIRNRYSSLLGIRRKADQPMENSVNDDA